MKNEKDRQIIRHSLPTRMYFNFFTLRTKILKFYSQPTNGTLAFAPTAQSQPFGKIQRAVSANAPTEHSDNKTDFLRILPNYKF
ncbi:MAG: hypothetical protein KBG17_07660 [Paludibacteraceae bacterium]|nr:hypothetical protein [Paludibacteraceae bacterium]